MPHWRTGPRPPPGASDARPEPFALSETAAGVERLAAVSAAAAAAGLVPGMALADARARAPDLTVRPDDPPAAARRLEALSDWAQRFAPWTAPCGADGLWLDISGCGHLFGGEAALAARLSTSLERRGHDCRVGVAATPGAAWALARFAGGGAVAAEGARAALAPLPTAALRLAPETAAALARVGMRRIGDLYPLPRAPLARRFGRAVLDGLDRALGRRAEPIAPRQPPPRYRAQSGFVEPVADAAPVAAALDALLDRLCADLARDGLGARRLTLRLFRVDGDERTRTVGAARARRDARGLAALFAEWLDGLDAGLGIEAMRLEAPRTEPLTPRQTRLPGIDSPDAAENRDASDPAALVDRLVNRLGSGCVVRLAPRNTHLPDRAVRRLPPWPEPRDAGAWPALPRPLRLFSPPHPVEAIATVPDGPPITFRWRGRAIRVAQAGGPERIAGEWWREDAPTRDYYRVEDAAGARYWLYREGFYGSAAGAPRWYLHGLFG